VATVSSFVFTSKVTLYVKLLDLKLFKTACVFFKLVVAAVAALEALLRDD